MASSSFPPMLFAAFDGFKMSCRSIASLSHRTTRSAFEVHLGLLVLCCAASLMHIVYTCTCMIVITSLQAIATLAIASYLGNSEGKPIADWWPAWFHNYSYATGCACPRNRICISRHSTFQARVRIILRITAFDSFRRITSGVLCSEFSIYLGKLQLISPAGDVAFIY